MDDEYLYWFVLIISLLIVVIVIPRFYFYTPRGDIENYHTEKLDNKMSNMDLIEAMYELSIYDYCKVRWHYTFLLSLVAAVFVLYIVDAFNLKNVIITTLVFFMVIEIPNRLENGHIKSTTTNKSTIIYGALSDRFGNNKKNEYSNEYSDNSSYF